MARLKNITRQLIVAAKKVEKQRPKTSKQTTRKATADILRENRRLFGRKKVSKIRRERAFD